MANNLIGKWWFKWLIVGIVIRVIVMPITIHPDLFGQSIASYYFSHEGIFDIYRFFSELPLAHPLRQNFLPQYLFIYPPLTYFTQGVLNLLVRPISDSNFIPYLMNNPSGIFTYPGFHLQILLLKLPYLIFDLGSAFLVSKLFTDSRKKILAFSMWVFNPLSLYATFMMGQNDILPVFFTILSLVFLKKKKPQWALLSLGMGGSYKLYPLLFIPVVAFLESSQVKNRIKYLFLGILPYLITTGPYLLSSAYRTIVLNNPESQKPLFMKLPVTGAEFIYVFIFILTFLYFYIFQSTRKRPYYVYFTSILLLLLSVTHFHPQWFFWVTPFMIIDLVKNRFRNGFLILVIFLSWVLITLSFEPSLSVGLFRPIWPEIVEFEGFSALIGRFTDVFLLKSLVRSVFAGTSAYLVYTLLSDSKKANVKSS